jgi:hypothetical protein
MLLLNVWWIYRRKDPALQFVAIVSAMGLALMQTQFRFSVFGEVPMLLTPVLAARFLYESRPELRRMAMAACCALFAVAFYPTIANWQLRWSLGGDMAYAIVRSTFPVLRSCARSARASYWAISTAATGFVTTRSVQSSPTSSCSLRSMRQRRSRAPGARHVAAQLLNAKPEVRYVFAHHSVTIHPRRKR